MAKSTAGNTPFDDPPAPVATPIKRYSPVMECIHKTDRLLSKLTPQERMQVYQWLKLQYEPPLLNQGLEAK